MSSNQQKTELLHSNCKTLSDPQKKTVRHYQLTSLTNRMLSNTSSARDAVRTILDFDERKRLLAVTFMWHWWLERNQVREGDQSMEPS